MENCGCIFAAWLIFKQTWSPKSISLNSFRTHVNTLWAWQAGSLLWMTFFEAKNVKFGFLTVKLLVQLLLVITSWTKDCTGRNGIYGIGQLPSSIPHTACRRRCGGGWRCGHRCFRCLRYRYEHYDLTVVWKFNKRKNNE